MQTKENRYHLHITLSRAESDTLCNDAKRCGLSRSVYLRRLIMKSPVKARPTEQIGKLYEEIHRIGNNINQIARSVNEGVATPETAAQSVFLMRKVYELMEQAARR